jgi:REP element-mobilizing transposase RayT
MPRTYTQLYYHVVFATKNRLQLLDRGWMEELWGLMGAVARAQGGTLVVAGGMQDHVHLPLTLRSEPSLARVMKAIKGSSSRWINESRGEPGFFAWQEGFAAFTVSASSLGRVRRYIENQEEHHRNRSTEDEWSRLLHQHGLEPGGSSARD